MAEKFCPILTSGQVARDEFNVKRFESSDGIDRWECWKKVICMKADCAWWREDTQECAIQSIVNSL